MKWQRLRFMPSTPLGENRVTDSESHRALSRFAASEGSVLLKNENSCLPIEKGTKLAVFGIAQFDYVKCGGGSGDVTTAYARNLIDGLSSKAEEGKIELYHPLLDFYRNEFLQQVYRPGNHPEPDLSDALIAQARMFADTAILAFCRYAEEAGDCNPENFYLTAAEEDLLQRITKVFPRCIVCLNIGNAINTSDFKDNSAVKALLVTWQGGMEGGMATADMLCGDSCPNGRLTDTFASSIEAYPGTENFLATDDYVAYEEDIYVGYRYFETIPDAAKSVCYPFGFGLSYGSFQIKELEWTESDSSFSLRVRVTNCGNFTGKHVVQVYCAAPQGLLGKPAKSLVGFAKTKDLQPGDFQDLYISFSHYDLASYDDTGMVCSYAYVMEKGTYCFYVGDNVRDAILSDFSYHISENKVISQLSSLCSPTKLEKRLLANGTYEAIPLGAEVLPATREGTEEIPFDGQFPEEQKWHIPYCAWHAPTTPQLMDVWDGKYDLDTFMDNLSTEQLVHLLGGQPNRGCANTFGLGNLPIYGIPNAMTADGPAGIRIRPECGVNTTGFPCATLLACTWDPDLVCEIGRAGGMEAHENGLAVWLTPAANIHRSPLCGRNFEYYSEDPLISGVMAAAMVKGMQEIGVAASLKHFACNNKEGNRRNSDSRVSERALREIYLKGFEICIKNSSPWTVMCSYNLLNGERISESKELLTDILRGEWAYDGLVITDWYTYGVQYAEIAAGADVKMGCGMPEHTMQMILDGKLSLDTVKQSVRRVLKMLLKLA